MPTVVIRRTLTWLSAYKNVSGHAVPKTKWVGQRWIDRRSCTIHVDIFTMLRRVGQIIQVSGTCCQSQCPISSVILTRSTRADFESETRMALVKDHNYIQIGSDPRY